MLRGSQIRSLGSLTQYYSHITHLFRDWAERILSFLSRVVDCVLEAEYHNLVQPFTSISTLLVYRTYKVQN